MMATKGQIQKNKDEKICQIEAQGAESIIQALKEDGLNLNANLTPKKGDTCKLPCELIQ